VNTDELSPTAIHEAGHAAIAQKLGHPLEHVELTPDGPDHEGSCNTIQTDAEMEQLRDGLEGGGDPPRAHDHIMILLAGRAAEQKAGCDRQAGGEAAQAGRLGHDAGEGPRGRAGRLRAGRA
jgi:hypothetical protein